jgi:hypothetical protein
MNHRSGNLLVALSCVATLAVMGLTYLASDQRRVNWIKFRIEYPEYLEWKQHGGPWLEKYSEPLLHDRHRDDLVSGLSYQQIRAKLPFLTDGDPFPADSYKGQHLAWLKRFQPDAKVLWFSSRDGFDWCVEIQRSEAQIRLVKG